MIRTLYAGQTVQILSQQGNVTGYLPVSSATCEVTRPIEAVTAFGHLGSLALAQTNLTTCKASIKSYLVSGANFSGTIAGGLCTGMSALLLQCLTGDAIQGNYTVINVTPNGFQMSGILSYVGVDIALGGFGTCDLTFNGIGEPYFYALSGPATADQTAMPNAIVPVTTVGVSGAINSYGCATSFKFTMDMPTDNLACLGDPPDVFQFSGMNSLIATKPPYKSTISVEGYGVNVSTTGIPPANSLYSLGGLSIALPHATFTSKSFNNAVGTANATFNYTVEDTTALFSQT